MTDIARLHPIPTDHDHRRQGDDVDQGQLLDDLTTLAPAEQRRAARQAWLAESSLTGAELAARFGRKERWGREQIAAARRSDTQAPSGTPDDHDGAPSTGTGTASSTPAPAARLAGRAATGRSTRERHAAAPVPSALLAVTAAAVALVTVVCAVVSYSHARHLADLAGQGGLAPWLPLAVDGLVAAATCSLLVDRRLGRAGHPLAWAGAALGLAGSFGANVVAVDPALVDVRHVRWVLAGYVPAALAIAGHLLIRMLGERQ
jgi:hypothetical protein